MYSALLKNAKQTVKFMLHTLSLYWEKRSFHAQLRNTSYTLTESDRTFFSEPQYCRIFKHLYDDPDLQNQFNSDSHTKILQAADAILDHRFDVLGQQPVTTGQQIPWHTDVLSNYTWPCHFYTSLIAHESKELSKTNLINRDVKHVFELSRFHHLVSLAMAYRCTKKKAYAEEIQKQISDWITKNPVGYGPHWTMAIEIAIRSCNWLFALELTRDSGVYSNRFYHTVVTSLHHHGWFIYNHLENKHCTNNHYLANCAGLLALACFLPFLPEAKSWHSFAITQFSLEIKKQVYDDGCNFEASTAYHRFATEILFFSALIAVRSHDSKTNRPEAEVCAELFGADFRTRLYSMFIVLKHLVQRNGKIPQIGDNDSGYVFKSFAGSHSLDVRGLLALGALFFNSPELKIDELCQDEPLFWFYNDGFNRISTMKGTPWSELPSRSFPVGGWYILRNASLYCCISCGENGQQGRGGHCHNDRLSLVLSQDGLDILVDPGTFVYMRDSLLRMQFRTTAMHNTLFIKGIEQARLTPDLFTLGTGPTIRQAQIICDTATIRFVGSIHYHGITHTRVIELPVQGNTCTISDTLSSESAVPHALCSLHLNPELTMDATGTIKSPGNVVINIQPAHAHRTHTTYSYAEEYGKISKGIALEYETQQFPFNLSISIDKQ